MTTGTMISHTAYLPQALGHDWNNYEFDDWEFYADAQAENDPSRAKFVPS